MPVFHLVWLQVMKSTSCQKWIDLKGIEHQIAMDFTRPCICWR